MVKLTDYGTLQAYVDATLATDGAPKNRNNTRSPNKYGEEGQMQTPQKMQEGQTPQIGQTTRKTPQKPKQEGQMQTTRKTPQKMQQTRKKGQ